MKFGYSLHFRTHSQFSDGRFDVQAVETSAPRALKFGISTCLIDDHLPCWPSSYVFHTLHPPLISCCFCLLLHGCEPVFVNQFHFALADE